MPLYLLQSFNKCLYFLSWEEEIKQTVACVWGVFDVALTILNSAIVPPCTTGVGELRLTSTFPCRVRIF